MFKFFRKPVQQEVTFVAPWRKGMWVYQDGKVGILHNPASGEVHIVNDAGETVLVTVVPLGAIRQATWLEIPEVRRPTIERAKELGYAT